jgi:hypothetical protein
MGMFDHIYIKKKLPLTKELKALDVNWEELDFQTKDLENALDTYEITKSGKLRHLWQEREWRDDDSAFLKGYFEVIKEEWRDVDFHGTINFYTTHTDNNDYHWDWISDDPEQMSWDDIELIQGYDWWFEFEAYFTKGKLDEIKLIKTTKDPIRERIKNNKLWSEKRAIENKKLHRKFINFMRQFSWYRTAVRYTLKLVNNAYSFLTKILYRM